MGLSFRVPLLSCDTCTILRYSWRSHDENCCHSQQVSLQPWWSGSIEHQPGRPAAKSCGVFWWFKIGWKQKCQGTDRLSPFLPLPSEWFQRLFVDMVIGALYIYKYITCSELCASVSLCICVCVSAQERIQQYFTQMRNVILQIKTTQCLVLSLFMPFYFLLCWHGCTCQEALKDIIGVVKNYWEARTFPCSDPPPSLSHLSPSNVTKFLSGIEAEEIKSKYCNQEAAGGKM